MQTITPALEALLKAKFQLGASGFRARLEVDHVDLTDLLDPVITTASYRVDRLAIDKSLRLEADQMEVQIPRPSVAPLGWGPTSVFQKGSRCRAYQWYGDAENEVRTFTGLIDLTDDRRDPLRVTLMARDMMALLLDFTFSTIAPQGADEEDPVRDETNGVFLDYEVSAIVDFVLDAVGWPADLRAITPTSYVVAEYLWQDGWSGAEAIIGDDRLGGLVGYNAWADELGVFHFAPSLATSSITETPTPDYVFRSGEDVLELADVSDVYALSTRVKVRGPLTSQTPTWREVWRATKFPAPAGVWNDVDEPDNLRVLERSSRYLYKVQRADRKTITKLDVSAICPYPGGLSGDPFTADTFYWLLNAPWHLGVSGGNAVKKVEKSSHNVVGTWSINTDHWSAIAVSEDFIWMTNLTDDKVYKRNRLSMAVIDSYSISYLGTPQTNPNGIMLTGTTLYVAFGNGNRTPRWLIVDESDPETVIGTHGTPGTRLYGGAISADGQTSWAFAPDLGLVGEYTLFEPTTDEVYAEVVDYVLEDQLGVLAQVEPRIHDAHPDDDPHPFVSRRDTVSIEVVASLPQAQDTATRRLEILSQPRRVVDAGIIGNPALQKTDVIGIVDPVTGLNNLFTIDTYRSTMDAEGNYVGQVSALAIPDLVAEMDDIEDEGDAEETGAPSLVQEASGFSGLAASTVVVTMPAPTGGGDLLIAVAFCRTSDYATPSGWTEVESAQFPGAVPANGYVQVFYRTTGAGGDTGFSFGKNSSNQGWVYVQEVAGVSALADSTALGSQSDTNNPVVASVSASAGNPAWVIAGIVQAIRDADGVPTYTPDAAYTLGFSEKMEPTFGPFGNVPYLGTAAADASYSPEVTYSGTARPWGGIAAVFE